MRGHIIVVPDWLVTIIEGLALRYGAAMQRQKGARSLYGWQSKARATPRRVNTQKLQHRDMRAARLDRLDFAIFEARHSYHSEPLRRQY